jgi:hypothetical protein
MVVCSHEEWQGLCEGGVVLVEFELVDGLAEVLDVDGREVGFFLDDVGLHLAHVLVVVFLLEEYPHLLQLYVFLLGFQPQQEDLLHQPVHHHEMLLKALYSGCQEVVDIGWEVGDECLQHLVVAFCVVYLRQVLQELRELLEADCLSHFVGDNLFDLFDEVLVELRTAKPQY